MKNFNMDELIKKYNYFYSEIYAVKDDYEGFDEAVRAFDNKEYDIDILNAFNKARFDVLISDREVAAFMLACKDLGLLPEGVLEIDEIDEKFGECLEDTILEDLMNYIDVRSMDGAVYAMDSINYLFPEPLEAITRSYYGGDGLNEEGQFNPNRDYFFINGYGNLVSLCEYEAIEYLVEQIDDKEDFINWFNNEK